MREKLLYYAYVYKGNYNRIKRAVEINEPWKKIQCDGKYITILDEEYPMALKYLNNVDIEIKKDLQGLDRFIFIRSSNIHIAQGLKPSIKISFWYESINYVYLISIDKKSVRINIVLKAGNTHSSQKQIKYIYKTTTDTITVEKFTQKEDSVWTVEVDNDTVKTNIEIKANELKWCNVSTEINDKFTLITQSDEDTNEVITEVKHSPNVEIQETTMWHKKKKWTDNFHHGPSVTAGYDVINKRFGMVVGYSIIYEF